MRAVEGASQAGVAEVGLRGIVLLGAIISRLLLNEIG